MYQVFIDGISTQINKEDFDNYNVIVNKLNSTHSFMAIEKHSFEKHWYSKVCQFTNKLLTYRPTHLTTKQITTFIQNSSEVSST